MSAARQRPSSTSSFVAPNLARAPDGPVMSDRRVLSEQRVAKSEAMLSGLERAVAQARVIAETKRLRAAKAAPRSNKVLNPWYDHLPSTRPR